MRDGEKFDTNHPPAQFKIALGRLICRRFGTPAAWDGFDMMASPLSRYKDNWLQEKKGRNCR